MSSARGSEGSPETRDDEAECAKCAPASTAFCRHVGRGSVAGRSAGGRPRTETGLRHFPAPAAAVSVYKLPQVWPTDRDKGAKAVQRGKNRLSRGVWLAQSGARLTLDSGSGHIPGL